MDIFLIEEKSEINFYNQFIATQNVREIYLLRSV